MITHKNTWFYIMIIKFYPEKKSTIFRLKRSKKNKNIENLPPNVSRKNWPWTLDWPQNSLNIEKIKMWDFQREKLPKMKIITKFALCEKELGQNGHFRIELLILFIKFGKIGIIPLDKTTYWYSAYHQIVTIIFLKTVTM